MKKNNKQKHEQPWTLTYTLVLQTMGSPLSSFFFVCSKPIGLPSKMMPCKQNHKWICIGLGPLFKLALRYLFKVALRYLFIKHANFKHFDFLKTKEILT